MLYVVLFTKVPAASELKDTTPAVSTLIPKIFPLGVYPQVCTTASGRYPAGRVHTVGDPYVLLKVTSPRTSTSFPYFLHFTAEVAVKVVFLVVAIHPLSVSVSAVDTMPQLLYVASVPSVGGDDSKSAAVWFSNFHSLEF